MKHYEVTYNVIAECDQPISKKNDIYYYSNFHIADYEVMNYVAIQN